MGRIRWLLPFKQYIEPTEWAVVKHDHQVDYYYVDRGFFKLRTGPVSICMTIVHILSFIGLHQLFAHKLWTLMFLSSFYVYLASLGVTGGSHRLWAHRAFEAKWPLRLFLMVTQTSAGIWSIRTWFMNHTAHHKWSDTDADPHNASRGLFFAHGFFQYKKQHPLNAIKEATIDDNQLMSDPIVRFQYDNFELLFVLFGMALPTATGMLAGGSLWHSFLICYALKHFIIMHLASLINSAAHVFGDKPWNSKILPGDNRVLSWFTAGEGYHNFHHQFPQDYATGEYGSWSLLTHFVEAMAAIGQAYNLKRSSPRIIELTRSKVLTAKQLGPGS
ncbi:Stearoyl-CoA desaturase 5 [Halotydeus destructor]|nr:Stearoyl-CoA desaturase 5 [Halotydeus destructor]